MSEVKVFGCEFALSSHCVERVRERIMEDETAGLEEAHRYGMTLLQGARLRTNKPSGLFGDGDADLWAVNGRAVFPLRRDRGKLVAVTALTMVR